MVQNLLFPHTSSPGWCLKTIRITVLVHLFPCLCERVFFFFFLQAHSFHPLVASLALQTSLVGSREKMEGEGTRCRCPTAADWRMCWGARLMLYKTNTTSLCWALRGSQKRQLKELKPLWSESLTNVYTVVTRRGKKGCHLFQYLSYLCYFYQIKYVKIKLKSEENTTMFDILDTRKHIVTQLP